MKRFGAILFLALAVILSRPVMSGADDNADLKNKMNELSSRVETLEAEKNDVKEKISGLAEITGYADVEYIMTDKPGEDNEFRIHHLSLFVKKQFTGKWRFFSEVEFEDGPFFETTNEGTTWKSGTGGKIFLEVMTLEYLYDPKLNIVLGRFFTPAGIWNVDHYPPFVTTQDRPQHIRKIFPQLTDGLQVNGAFSPGSTVVSYNLYAGNGEGNTGAGDNNEGKALGGRIKLKLPLLTKTEFGLSAYTDSDKTRTDKNSFGADLSLQWKSLKFQGEYAQAAVSPGEYEITGYYGQLIYAIGDWDLIYRHDRYDPKSTVINDGTTINTLAVNHHFTPVIVGKLEHHFVDQDNDAADDYNRSIFSLVVYLSE